MARITFEVKQRMVQLAGACFWYWRSYYAFLEAAGVPRRTIDRYPRNAYSKYDVMRNVLAELEERNETETINALVSNFFRMTRAADEDVPDKEKAKRLLKEFQAVVGNDPIEKEIEKRRLTESRERYQATIAGSRSRRERLEALNQRFLELNSTPSTTPQQRGYRLEELFCDLLELNELEYTRPYRHAGEQIDGHFRYEKFDYLIESKWEQEPIKQSQLSIFDGKIRGKAQSTRGLFLAANGFDPAAISKFSGDSPRILLMTGEDLALVLGSHVDFLDALRAKVDAIVRHGNICFPLRRML